MTANERLIGDKRQIALFATAPQGPLAVVLDGTNGNDILVGTADADTINGLGGNDQIDGGAGDDVLDGGAGFDTLVGGAGNDRLIGGDGQFDILDGGAGDDFLDGGTGGERQPNISGTILINGGDVARYFDVASGVTVDLAIVGTQDTIGAGRDTLVGIEDIYGSTFDDTLSGNGGANLIVSGDGNDRVFGRGGNDVLVGGRGNDIIDGGDGDDLIWAGSTTDGPLAFGGNDIVRGGNGNDRILGSAGNDTLQGDDGNDDIAGYAGADILVGGAGNDLVSGDLGDLTIDGGSGNDTISVSPLEQGESQRLTLVTAGSGDDTVSLALFAQPFDLRIEGGDGMDRLEIRDSDQGASLPVQTVWLREGGTSGITALGFETVNILDNPVIVHGSDGDDQIVCSTSNGILRAPSNDVLRGYGGSDLLNGGLGMDTAVYAGVRRQYGASSTSVAGGPEGGTDTLVSIEELRFVDGVLSFDVNGIAAQVMRLYDATLDRQPDQAGLDVQIRALTTGVNTLQGLANLFVASAEFQSRYGTLSNQAFVEQLYRFSLDREGDAAGIAVQVNALNTGTSRAALVVAFSESPEHRQLTQPILNAGLWVANDQALQIARLYDATFDRLPDAAGLAGQLAALNAGVPLIQLAANFAASAEFQARYGALSNQAFVEQLYRFCLDREGDAPGIALQVNALNSGLTRAQLLLNFSESAEHITLTAPSFSGGIRTVDALFNGAPVEAQDSGAKQLDDGAQVLVLAEDDARIVTAGEVKHADDQQPQVLVLAEDASTDAKTIDVAQVNPALVAYDPADIVIDFKIADDAFVLPPQEELSPLVVPVADGIEAGLLSFDGLTFVAQFGEHALTLIQDNDDIIDHPLPGREIGHDDGWWLV